MSGRNRAVPPCDASVKYETPLGTAVLTCNLKLADHGIHHDPGGLWWARCHTEHGPYLPSHDSKETGND